MKIILQDGIKDCGICCFLSIVRHYGGNISKEYLREITNTNKDGVSAYNLVEAAKKLGFDSYAVTGDIVNLEIKDLPVIAHININRSYKHFVVIYDIDQQNKKILIMDPAVGKKNITLSEFKLQSSGNFIIMKPLKKIPNIEDKHVVKNTILKYIKKEKKYFSFILLLTSIYFFLNILTAFHFKYLLQFAIDYKVDANILLITIILILMYLLKQLSFYMRNILLLKYSQVLDYIITTRTYKQIILLPYLYYKNRTIGEVVSRIKELNNVKGYIINAITSISTDFLCIIIFLIILFSINKTLAIISFLLFILLILVDLSLKKTIKKRTNQYYMTEEDINSNLIESLSSVDAIKGMHIEKRIIDIFGIKYKKYLSATYSLLLTLEINKSLKNIIHNLFLSLILYFGTKFVNNGNFSLTEFIVFQSIYNFYISSFQNIIDLIEEYPKFKISLERVEDIFQIKNEVFVKNEYFNEQKLEGEIVYKNLNYSYTSKKIFTDINFKIENKTKLLLSGPSGTGKSTFVKMLMRYVPVPFSTISIGNIDINHYSLDVLRNEITYVSSNEFLFNDTILNNITLHKKVDLELVRRVIMLTHVNELGDINKRVEENGFNLSSGERQRIILARTLLKNSYIYIFDEALGQVDTELERDILINIIEYLKDKIVIVISHRQANKDLFDRIVRIENSSIYEEKI